MFITCSNLTLAADAESVSRSAIRTLRTAPPIVRCTCVVPGRCCARVVALEWFKLVRCIEESISAGAFPLPQSTYVVARRDPARLTGQGRLFASGAPLLGWPIRTLRQRSNRGIPGALKERLPP